MSSEHTHHVFVYVVCNACMHKWSHQMEKSSCKDVAKSIENERATTVTATVISIQHQRCTTKCKVWKANYDGLIIRQWKLMFSVFPSCKSHCTLGLSDATPLRQHTSLYFARVLCPSTHSTHTRTHIFIIIFLLSFTCIVLVAVCACSAFSCFSLHIVAPSGCSLTHIKNITM